MKKSLIGILAATALLSMGIIKTHALEHEKQQNWSYTGDNGSCSFVDMDHDGICDNCGVYHRNNSNGNGYGRYCVDDNYVAGRCGERRGYGHHGGCHR